jgi:hypothetical protein
VPDRTPLEALVGAMSAAAERRGIAAGAAWQAVTSVLDEWCQDSVPARAIAEDLDAITAVFELDSDACGVLLVAAAADIDPNIALA